MEETMATRIMTVFEALNQTRVLEKRIPGLIEQLEPVVPVRDGLIRSAASQKYKGDVKAWGKDHAGRLQQIEALIENRRRLKAAIVQSNATTTVNIGGTTMTVAEAIEFRRDTRAMYQALMAQIGRAYTVTMSEAERTNAKARAEAEKAVGAMLGDAKVDQETIVPMIEARMKASIIQVAQAFDVEGVLESLRVRLEKFDTEVDAALTTANVTAQVEVDLVD
jgi:hypothetical protein